MHHSTLAVSASSAWLPVQVHVLGAAVNKVPWKDLSITTSQLKKR